MDVKTIMMNYCRLALIALLVSFSTQIIAQEDDEPYLDRVNIGYDYRMMDGAVGRLEPHGNDLMGDMIDKKTGALTIEHTDINIPGNSNLEVAIRRKHRQGHQDSPYQHAFDTWVLDIPMAYSIRGYDALEAASALSPQLREACGAEGSYDWGAPFGYFNVRGGNIGSGPVAVDQRYVNVGVTLSIPGKQLSGYQGGFEDPKFDWAYGGQETDYLGRCAEVTIAPDGTKYKFGLHTLRDSNDMFYPVIYNSSSQFEPGLFVANRWIVKKYSVYLITEVEDVHGNWVRYEYTDDHRAELERISSNDGREIDLYYDSFITSNGGVHRNSRHVTHITVNNDPDRTWNYEYTPLNVADIKYLDKVILPDGRYWDLWDDDNSIGAMSREPKRHWDCVFDEDEFSIKHPDGAIGTFKIREERHIKNAKDLGDNTLYEYDHYMRTMALGAPSVTNTSLCAVGPQEYSDRAPEGMPVYRAWSVVEKTISGPNIPTATWTFDYRGDSFTEQSLDEVWTTITEPDGTERTYTYQAIGFDHGTLKRIDVSSPSGAGETVQYDSIGYGGTSGCTAGGIYGDQAGACLAFRKRRMIDVVRARDGETYYTEYAYDYPNGVLVDHGRPNTITRYSTLQAEQRVQEIDYWHNTSANIIGLTESVTHNGVEFARYEYNLNGQIEYTYSMGSDDPWHSYTYYSDGTVQSITDPLDHTATFTNYHRGLPENITLRDNTLISRTVNDDGWVMSETNGRGFTTYYDYTSMGWMTEIDRPAPWDDTFISYSNLGEADFQRSITLGTKETVEWYDSMLRPYLVREGSTLGDVPSYVKTSYDTMGRTSFTSLPSSLSDPDLGIYTSYDGLGRVDQIREGTDAVTYSTTSTDYLSGNQVRVTDPLFNETTTTRSGYGSPNDGNPTLIQQPEGVNTVMTYDIWGNIETATQYGNANGYNETSTQRWSYNDELLLCRHYTPETGSSLYGYDDAHQLTHYREGQSGTDGCLPSALGDSVSIVKTYDARGRVDYIAYPGSTLDVDIEYDANGNVETNFREGVNWTYTYNSLDLLETETLQIDGLTYGLSYQYTTMGDVEVRTLPSGRDVNYQLDGLGRVTDVDSDGVDYATSIDYYANGLIESMTYGNSQVFTQTLNDRQLPRRLTSEFGVTTAMDLQYEYNARGDVTNIIDWADRGRDRMMTYDDLGRLDTADGVWGAGSFEYDPLSNLRAKELGGRTVTVSLDSTTNRATQSADTDNGTRGILYDDRGNVTSLGGLGFVYDMANQPVQLTGDSTGSYVYDGNFKRVKAEVDGTTIYNIYDASGSLVHVEEVTGADLTICFENCQNLAIPKSSDYIRANGMTIARLENGAPTYMHPDLLGSPVAGTDAQGNLAWEEHYTPFGEKWASAAANDDQMGFTGHISDSATGLTYMQARYYDPAIGRFLANDPVGFQEHMSDGQGAQGFNRYAYVSNDPYGNIDPDGRLSTGHDIWQTFAYTDQGYVELDAQINGGMTGASIGAGFYVAPRLIQIAGLHAAATGNPLGLLDMIPGGRGMRSVPLDAMIYRMGRNWESPTRLERKAKEAEDAIGVHGVSGNTDKPNVPCSSARCSDLEDAGFPVTQTGSGGHVTIELPKPVTKETAERFHEVLERPER